MAEAPAARDRERLRPADDLDPERMTALPEDPQTRVRKASAELDSEPEARR